MDVPARDVLAYFHMYSCCRELLSATTHQTSSVNVGQLMGTCVGNMGVSVHVCESECV